MAHRTETTTMPASADHSLLSKAFDWLKARMSRDNEFALMSPADMHALATDIGISHNELQQVVRQAGDHSDLMDQMIRARGLDPVAVRRALNGARYMEVTCALCLESGICRRELEAGTAAEHSHAFCANAPAIDEMLEMQLQPPTRT